MSKIIPSILRKILNISSDISSVTISTIESIDLVTEFRSVTNQDESHLISTYIPSFVMSCKQASKLGLGTAQHSILWTTSGIIVQKEIGGLILTIILDETANIGIVNDSLGTIENILLPFCTSFLSLSNEP